MAVAGEGSGKWASKLIADGFIPLHEQAGNLQHHIVGVVRHDAIQVRSGPCVVVLFDERFDVRNRLDGCRNRHGWMPTCHFRGIGFHYPTCPFPNSMIPRRRAIATAWVRSLAPSFSMICLM